MEEPSIRTSRLLLRRWRCEDVEPFAAMCGDPEVMRYIGSGTTRTREQSAGSIRAFERQWNRKGYGLFAVERIDGNRLIGFTGLSEPDFLSEIMPAVELGWRFERQAWGRGYATEAARAALDFGLRRRGLASIVSICQAANAASGRIAHKLGMHLEQETRDPTCGRLVHVYRTPGG